MHLGVCCVEQRVRDYEELKVTASRLMRHIQARDDKIARMTQVRSQSPLPPTTRNPPFLPTTGRSNLIFLPYLYVI
jgi:hypothetical protein